MKFSGKKIIVTGASRSMGRQMAIDFAKEGADIVISYRNNKQGALETVEMIKSNGGHALALHADFSTMEGVQSFAENALAHLGAVNILINNAGMLCRETLFELEPEKMQEVFQVNTISPLYLAQLCAKDMIEKENKGSIVNISSISGIITMSKGVGYSAAKAAMNKWTQNIALTLGEHGIRVNAIAPGVIASGMNQDTETNNPELWGYYIKKIPLKKFGSPNDISKMALFLASNEADWITGKIFEVDGGHTLVALG